MSILKSVIWLLDWEQLGWSWATAAPTGSWLGVSRYIIMGEKAACCSKDGGVGNIRWSSATAEKTHPYTVRDDGSPGICWSVVLLNLLEGYGTGALPSTATGRSSAATDPDLADGWFGYVPWFGYMEKRSWILPHLRHFRILTARSVFTKSITSLKRSLWGFWETQLRVINQLTFA